MDNFFIRTTARLIRWFSFSPTVSKMRIIWRYASLFSLMWITLSVLVHLLSADASATFSCAFLAVAILTHGLFKNELNKTLNTLKTTEEIDTLFVKNTTLALAGSFLIGTMAFFIAAALGEPAFADSIIALAVSNFLLNLILSYLSIPKNLRPVSSSEDFPSPYETSTRHYTDFCDASNTAGLMNPASPSYYRRHD